MTNASNAPSVLRQFRMIFNAVKTHFQQVEKQAGLGGAKIWALSVVAQHPGICVGDLASTMDIHQSTASNLVKVLSNQTLLLVQRDLTDKRTSRLFLTNLGHEKLLRAPTPFAGVLPEALEQLDEQTLLRLQEDLTKLLALLGGNAKQQAAQTPLAEL